MDVALDDVFLMSTHDYAVRVGVECLRPEVAGVHWITAVFKGNQMVFFIASHIIGAWRAQGGIDFPRVGTDKFRPGLANRIPILSKLIPLQFACVFPRGANLLRAPQA